MSRACLHCGGALHRSRKPVHRACARHILLAPEGPYRQLVLVDDRGQLVAGLIAPPPPVPRAPRAPRPAAPARPTSPVVRPKYDFALVLRPRERVSAPAVAPIEAYIHTPGKCAKCGKRVRNKSRLMHRRCLREALEPPKPKPLPRVHVDYPAARFCPACRSLDNSVAPLKVCRSCGRDTEVADRVLPSTAPPPKKRKRRTTG